jgi:glycerol-3-phosphate dehydrogenase subunit B
VSVDVVVVGAGLAGLTAALRVAEQGMKVVVVTNGVGSLHLGGATIDVLGYAPERVDAPGRALPDFVARAPEHPYARLRDGLIADSIEWLKAASGELGFSGDLEKNMLLPTAVGAAKPTAVAPASMANGDLRNGGRYAVVGLPALKDFYPAYAADNLIRSAPEVTARPLHITPPVGREADPGPVRLARHFDDAEFRKAVIRELEGQIESGEKVAFPAILGLDDGPTVWRELQDGLGAEVFEVATLPPSIPGIRLWNVLRVALRRAGGRIVTGPVATGVQAESGSVTSVVADTGARPHEYPARHFVLATGGVATGGIELDSRWRFTETVFGLAVHGAPAAGEARFSPRYFDNHPASRVGVAVDDLLRPVDEEGRVVYDNLHAVGATIAGAEPWREKSGNGISLATGYAAAEAVLGSEA